MQEGCPRVSVVIPAYCHTTDHEVFLAEALRSVAGQSYRDFEVVIVDDMSPIDILPLLRLVEDLPETRILRNAVNMGHAESRNVGIRAARGELIAFLDHDDIWLPEKLERQVAALDANPDGAMVFCETEIFGPGAEDFPIDQSDIPERPSFPWLIARGNVTISATAVLVRKQAMLDIGLFDGRYTTYDDFDAWLKILMNSCLLHLPYRLAKYRLHDYNVNTSIDRLNDNRLLTALILRYWRTAPFADKLGLLPLLGRKFAGRLWFALQKALGRG